MKNSMLTNDSLAILNSMGGFTRETETLVRKLAELTSREPKANESQAA
jgi:hypothetical protein